MKMLKNIEIVNNPETIKGYRVFNDAKKAKEQLMLGETIARFERGISMHPILMDGEYAIITPISVDGGQDLKVGDSVFCEVRGMLMTHMIVAISDTALEGRLYLIGSSRFELFGWTANVYGIAKGTRIFETETDEFGQGDLDNFGFVDEEH